MTMMAMMERVRREREMGTSESVVLSRNEK